MDEDRNLGVTEARFALTLLTCLLVAIGYIALLRLGGPKDTSGDVTPNDVSPPSIVGPEAPPVKTELPPRVLPLENPNDSPAAPASVAKRPPTTGEQSPEPERR